MRVWDHFRQLASRQREDLRFPIAGKDLFKQDSPGIGVRHGHGVHSLWEGTIG